MRGIILLLVFAGPYAIGLFHMNQAATAIGVEYLQTLAWFFLIFCIMYITNGVLQGSGDVAYPTAGSMTSLIVRVIVANIMATFPAIGYRSIFYSIPIGWVCGTAIVFIRYLTGKWKTKGVHGSAAPPARRKRSMSDIIAAFPPLLPPPVGIIRLSAPDVPMLPSRF